MNLNCNDEKKNFMKEKMQINFLKAVVRTDKDSYIEICEIDMFRNEKSFFCESYTGAVGRANSKQDRDIYFGIFPRKLHRSMDYVTMDGVNFSAIYINIDYGKPNGEKNTVIKSKEEALNRIKRINFLQPSFVVSTGYSYQLYWLLKEPINITEPFILLFKSTIRQIAGFYGGNIFNSFNKELRVPFTIYTKDNEKFESTLLHYEPERRYELAEIVYNLSWTGK